MFNNLSIVLISINLIFIIKCHLIQSHKIKNNKETCITDRSTSHLQVCYVNDISNSSSLVWFTINKSLNDTFHSYRFILQSINDLLSMNVITKTLTNFTKFVEFNNSLRLFNLDSGIYEICIEFQSNTTIFIYKPRDGCISIRIGKPLNESIKETPAPLLISLASGIVLFFILGLVVQRVKSKRKKQDDDDDEPRSRSSSILSMTSLRQQRNRLVQSLFNRHIDQPRVSSMRQWARIRAFRHRISTQEQEVQTSRSFRHFSRYFHTPTDQLSQPRSRTATISHDQIPPSEVISTTNNIYTISNKEHDQIPPRKVSFHLLPSEEYEMTSEK